MKDFEQIRFIPTRMGNTVGERMGVRGLPVHPHTHGEHRVCAGGVVSHCGSSPHAWGTRFGREPLLGLWRFIPTRMGNTGCPDPRRSPRSVHPHTHGEHTIRTVFVSPGLGSSPHAWGTRGAAHRRLQPGRFIPTRMGNTISALHQAGRGPVHPHTHGEHSVPDMVDAIDIGSSPHAWGTQRSSPILVISDRFIPTRMGNTET